MTSKTIKFLIQGSQADPYKVVFSVNGTSLTAHCNCPAGENGMYCKHRMRILCGDDEGIVSGNNQDIQLVIDSLKSSSLNVSLQELLASEKNFEQAKKDLSIKKKRMSNALIGKLYDSH